jgi:hypothetical protein
LDLQWVCWRHYVHTRDESYIGKRVERMEVRGRKGRGRPKKRWKDCVNQEDLGEKNLSGHEYTTGLPGRD